MRKNSRFFRLTATVAMTALLWETVLPVAASAQPAPPPLPAPGAGRPDLNQNQADPPARVGRIAGMTGAVSFHNLGDTQWSAATANFPVSSGNAFWTQPPATARLEVSDSRIVMAPGTEFDVSTLDTSGLQGVAAQGEVYLHLRDLAPNEVWAIQTPRGQVTIRGEGRYDIVVGTTDQPTMVTVVEGAAQIDGPGLSLPIAANQTATITGTDSFQGAAGPEQRGAFLTAQIEAERPPPAPAQAAAPPAQVVAMCGGSDLAGTGSWSQAPTYGQVWYPPVPATWVPYREGHWAYVAPWGWTWIDDASWGFAPFHYGRWVQIEGRWAWTPGEIAVSGPPVYAPALVTFIGIGAGIALGAAIASGTIGWVPLGPREEYHPWYHASNNYLRQVNIGHVTNITNNVTINNYVNRAAATSIPAAVMVASRPVQAVARPVTPQQFAAARPITGQQPIRPTAATVGVTPVVARQLSLAPVAHAAPGPAVRPVAAGVNGFARPTFAPAAGTEGPRAAEPGHPAAIVPGEKPAAGATPELAHPAAVHPEAPVPGEPAAARPEAAKPEAGKPEPPHPEAATPEAAKPPVVHPEAVPQAAARPAEPAAERPEAAARPVEHAAVKPEAAARPAEPAAARPEAAARPVEHAAARPEAAPRPEAKPAARPTPAAAHAEPRPEPPRAAPPPPHPEARPAAAPRPEEHKKEPG